jgi:orotate phosphoribosyltransferase
VNENDVLVRDAAADLHEQFCIEEEGSPHVDAVVGSRPSAAKLARYVSEHVDRFTGNACFSISPMKKIKKGVTYVDFDTGDLVRLHKLHVLVCTDTYMAGTNVRLVSEAIRLAGGRIIPYVLVLANHSGKRLEHESRLLSLVDLDLPVWDECRCPLCDQGSVAVCPVEHWDQLVAFY